MRTCTGCGATKPDENFPYRSLKTGKRKPKCRPCHSLDYKRYCEANPEKRRESIRRWDAKNTARRTAWMRKYRAEQSDRYQVVRRRYYERNKEKITEINAQWKRENPERAKEILAQSRRRHMGRVLAHNGKRRAAKLRATPKWADEQRIAEIYAEARRRTNTTGIPLVVDHVVPLKSNIVCGLHCEANLQVITRAENQQKGNRWWPDMP